MFWCLARIHQSSAVDQMITLHKKKMEYVEDAYNLRGKINLVVSCRPYPRLISSASFNKPTPCIPPNIIVVWVVVSVREVPNIQYCFSFCWV